MYQGGTQTIRITIAVLGKQQDIPSVCLCPYYCLRYPTCKAPFLPRMILTAVACLSVLPFSTLTHKRQDFRGGGNTIVFFLYKF